MTLSEKEKVICNNYNKGRAQESRTGLHDVLPEEILNTFNNSIDQ